MSACAKRYVALGSSMAAGPGIQPRVAGSPRAAGRSARNYPHLVARSLSLDLVDVTYSGATTAHVLTESQRGAPPQVDALDGDLRRREVSVGEPPIPEGVEALTIDRAQGRDVDCVVLSFCRANAARDAGRLLADKRRLNVALTRARSKLVLVGHGDTLRHSPVLSQVLGVVLENGWMFHLPPPM